MAHFALFSEGMRFDKDPKSGQNFFSLQVAEKIRYFTDRLGHGSVFFALAGETVSSVFRRNSEMDSPKRNFSLGAVPFLG